MAVLAVGSSPGAAQPPLSRVKLPDGFSISVFQGAISGARSLAQSPGGIVFVGTRSAGTVWALVDADNDGMADQRYQVATGLDTPNGVAFSNGSLYVAEVSRILRYDNIESQLASPPSPVEVLTGLPTDANHEWRYIRFGPDGRLYLAVGAPCNICERDDPYAAILRLSADGTSYEVRARGVRNTLGFDWHPTTRQLWFTDNGRDFLGDDSPPDELNVLTANGQHFGFPYCHGSDTADPVFGNQRTCSEFQAPVQALGPHVAALGMRFYTKTAFPARYRRQIFIAEHGSWNRTEPIGYRIMLVRLGSNGRPVAYEEFATGWLQDGTAWGRPVDVMVRGDGSLLVSDDRADVVYRIAYGSPPADPPTNPPVSNPGGGGGGGGGTADRRPEVARELGDRALTTGAALTLDLSDAFRSPGGESLSHAASSSDPSVAAVAVDGAALTVRGLAPGEAEVRVTATDGGGRSISQRFVVTVTAPEAVWYLPPASDPALQGFVRLVNRSDGPGEVTVAATDDAGREPEPQTLRLEARAATHFNSHDLESGNAAKGLSGGTGPGTGGWRLEFRSETLDVEALAYLRTADGFLTAMNVTAPRGDGGALRLGTFNPASNTSQVSRLRLVNPTDSEAVATVTGVDDSGSSPGSPVALTVPAKAACEVDAAELEAGRGLACGEPQAGLGDGTGKWRLSIASEAPLVAMGLLSSPSGHLANLSGAAAEENGVWRVPLFPSASDRSGRQGFVRVASRSDRAGTVTIRAFDDAGTRYAPLTLRLAAREAKHVNSDDLELGNRAKALTGGTGSGRGAWRLELSSLDIEFEANAYVRHRDGFLTTMQAVVPSMNGAHRIAAFNPGSNTRQVSVLRLVNRGSQAAVAAVTGADDRGVRPGGAVEVPVPAGAAVELNAAELESGEADAIASGALGDGRGKWRLHVGSDGDLAVISLLSSPMGRLTNLSGTGGPRGFAPLPSLPPPPSRVTLEEAGNRRVRGEWAAVPGMRYGVDLLRGGTPVEGGSLARTTRTSFRWSSLEAGTYRLRVRSVDAGGQAGPWSDPSNEVVID